MEQETAPEPDEASFISHAEANSDFISMIAHELRTPLHTVNGFLSIVLEEHVGKLNERQREFLEYAHASADQLITLVNDMIFISRADGGRFRLRCAELVLSDVIAQVLHETESAARKAQVALQNQAPEQFPTLWADAGALRQALVNLVHHALRFTPPGGSVTIRARQVDKKAEISVIDTGYGIPLEDQPHVFERFYQSSHTSLAQYGNFGLGLAIARMIIERHGGRIWLQSGVESGSTFVFTIPLFARKK